MTTESQKALGEFVKKETDPSDIEAIGAAIHAFIDCEKDLGLYLASRPAIYRMKKAIDAYMSASRQHIIDKLQSEEMVERVTDAIRFRPVIWQHQTEETAKAAIAAVLEGI